MASKNTANKFETEENPRSVFTTDTGMPVDSNLYSLTVGTEGPILLQDFAYLHKLARFDRERIPERVVHAKGAGAHGYFEVTSDVARKNCKAKFLSEVGKKTPVFVRFSQVMPESGSADTVRDPRGFAIKFYTEDGNLDLVGNNTPVFFIRDPIQFPDLVHSMKRDPQSHMWDNNAFWDFMSFHPEGIHQYMMLFSDRGIPLSYRNMHGFAGHTFKLVNEEGKQVFCKWHFVSESGAKSLTDQQATHLQGTDPNFLIRDLFNHLDKGGEATWKVCLQIIPIEEGLRYKFNIFDITKVVSKKDYPLIEIGRLVLNRNPTNYFAEVEQVAFSPSHLVPGIEPSMDRLLQGRLFSYPDTHLHRLGVNYLNLPINSPLCKVTNNNADGLMNTTNNMGASANYYPNSYGGPKPNPLAQLSPMQVSGSVGRMDVTVAKPEDDFVQPGILYREVMTEEDRKNLINNLCSHMISASKEVLTRVVPIWAKVDKDLGNRLSKGLGLEMSF